MLALLVRESQAAVASSVPAWVRSSLDVYAIEGQAAVSMERLQVGVGWWGEEGED